MINTGLINQSSSGTGTLPNGLLKTPLSLTTSLQAVTDNGGTASLLQLSTTKIGILGNTEYSWIAAPTGVASRTSFFFDASGRMSWRNGTGFLRTFDAMSATADRVYTLPDATTALAGLAVVNTFTERQLIAAPILTGSLTTSALSITQTLNTTGSPDVINLDVTNTASGATTNLLNLRVAGTPVFRVNRLGGITVAGASVFSASTTFASTIDTSGGSNFRIATQPNKTLLINNTYTNVAAPTAIMELQSTNQGFLPPKMTNAQRLLIGSGTPVVGLMVYCTDAVEGLYVYKSTGWTFMV